MDNQISATIKYDPDLVSFEEFKKMMLTYQPSIKCCSVMQRVNDSAYEYQPEQAVTCAEFEEIANAIQKEIEEEVGIEHLACEGGACPIDFNRGAK